MNLKKIFITLALATGIISGISATANAQVIDNNTVKPAHAYYHNINDTCVQHTPYVPFAYTVVQTNGGRLNVRQGPGTKYSIIGSLANHETASLLGTNRDRDWNYIRYGIDGTHNSKVGWVFGTFSPTYSD